MNFNENRNCSKSNFKIIKKKWFEIFEKKPKLNNTNACLFMDRAKFDFCSLSNLNAYLTGSVTRKCDLSQKV